MKKILFLIHDLGRGGAEKVLVNLVNHMDRSEFDVTVEALFAGGVNEQFLAPDIHFHAVFPRSIPGNSHWMKLLTPAQLHRLCVKETYDIEVAYLEGPSARVISGCGHPDTKLVSWIHSTQTEHGFHKSFRSRIEAVSCYKHMDRIGCVSQGVKHSFESVSGLRGKNVVLYNTIDSSSILSQMTEKADGLFEENGFRIVSVGKLAVEKGIDRIARIHKRLRDEGYPVHTYALGVGPEQARLEEFFRMNGLEETFTFLGYQTNPYKYIQKCDLFVCASFAEGFSTAATEALIVGTPVCTVEVSGMKEMLGEHNEYGIVTENSEDALYEGIKTLLDDPALLAAYKEKAAERGRLFRTEETVRAVEDMLRAL